MLYDREMWDENLYFLILSYPILSYDLPSAFPELGLSLCICFSICICICLSLSPSTTLPIRVSSPCTRFLLVRLRACQLGCCSLASLACGQSDIRLSKQITHKKRQSADKTTIIIIIIYINPILLLYRMLNE